MNRLPGCISILTSRTQPHDWPIEFEQSNVAHEVVVCNIDLQTRDMWSDAEDVRDGRKQIICVKPELE